MGVSHIINSGAGTSKSIRADRGEHRDITASIQSMLSAQRKELEIKLEKGSDGEEEAEASADAEDSENDDAMNMQFNLVKGIAEYNKTHDREDASPMPLIRTGGSIQADIKMGWRPKNPYSGAPIPLYYDYENFSVIDYEETDPKRVPLYLGPRVHNSLQLHTLFAKKEQEDGTQSYKFVFPPRPGQATRKRAEEPRPFTGMNPRLEELMGESFDRKKELVFDSFFESGNLDLVYKGDELEYNLFMRVDTNTRGHHQWFYFSVEHGAYFKGKTVTFNIMNFTKEESLYTAGMRLVVSKRSEGFKNKRGGSNVTYGRTDEVRRAHPNPFKARYYYRLQFQHTFSQTVDEDKVYFSYCFPYTFSKLQNFIREITASQTANRDKPEYLGVNLFCKSLSGADVPILTVTSRLTTDPAEYNLVKLQEFDDNDSKVAIPLYKKKKYMIITGRVHPGESNSSFMMQGFVRGLLGNSLQAKELRKRIIFKIVPMLNVDGVIIGNYRTSMAGNDLNRRYRLPDHRLHPEICSIKELVQDLIYGKRPGLWAESASQKGKEPEVFDEDIIGFIDMHGHSRKKNVFIYGNQYSLSTQNYYRTRIIPKLLAEETSKFRYHSCQFKYEHSKRKTARIVLAQEFNIQNCYTLEASFHGHFDELRENYEFSEASYEEIGEHLVNSLYEYILIVEEEHRLRHLREIDKKKRKRQAAALASLRQ